MSEPRLLLEEVNPEGNVEAVVEDDGRTTYLYWNPAPPLGRPMRAVWLRNAGAAPGGFDVAGMQDGRAPQLPAKFCKFPLGGQPTLRAEDLRAVWTEDGAGLFLLERSELLACVATWSDVDHGGFTRDAASDSPIAATLGAERLADAKSRLARAQAFWARWEQPDAWPAFRAPLEAALESALGKAERSFDVRKDAWPPAELRVFGASEGKALVSVGGSLRPQPVGPEAGALAPKLRRIELGVATDASVPQEQLTRLWEYVGTQLGYPWAMLSWLGNGHTMPCDALPGFEAALWLAAPAGAPRLALPDVDGEPVNLLWLVPITAQERAFAREHGSAALAQRLADAGVGWRFRARTGLALT